MPGGPAASLLRLAQGHDPRSAKFVERSWPGDAVTLRIVDADCGQRAQGRRILHELGNGLHAHGMTDLVDGFDHGAVNAVVDQVADADVDRLCAEYDERYEVVPELRPGGERRAWLVLVPRGPSSQVWDQRR